MSKVSVVIPVYNRAAVIERALESVLAQTYRDMEIIVVDDGSTDNTVGVVRSICDDRIRCIPCKANRGSGAARNEGLNAATGKYVAFLDSDDEWLPEKIEKQVALMESLSEDWGICQAGAYCIKDGVRTSTYRPKSVENGNAFRLYALGKLRCPTPNVMLRKSVLDEVGSFNEFLRRGQDTELFLRVFRKFKMAVTPEALTSIHCDTIKQLSHHEEPARLKILKEHQDIIRKELGWYAARAFRAHMFWLIADAKFRDRELLSGFGYWLEAMKSLPFVSPRRYARMMLAASGLLPGIRNAIQRMAKPRGASSSRVVSTHNVNVP